VADLCDGARLGLRSIVADDVLMLDVETCAEALQSRADLVAHAAAIAGHRAGHELVLVGDGAALPVTWTGRRGSSPVQTPVSSDGRWLFSIERGPGVVVRAEPVTPVAQVQGFAIDATELVVTFRSPEPPTCVVLTASDGSRISTLPVEAHDDHHRFRLGHAHVTVAEGEVVRLDVVVDDGAVPLRRSHTDVRHQGTDVILPLLGGDPLLGGTALTVMYRHDGHLAVRRQTSSEEPSLT
jgi:hypothetical protein